MSRDADQQLIDAVIAADETAVGRALASGADPDTAVARFRGSVLVEAARSGQLGIVTLLVEAGAHMGQTGTRAASPLRVAVLQEHCDVVRYLADRGALALELEHRSSVLTDAISHTAFRPRPTAVETLRALLDAGAVPRATEETPLITGMMRPVAPTVLRLLLDYGADPDQRRSDATPAIVIAARRGDSAAVDVLLQAGADVDARDAQGRTALMHAVERDEQRVAASLLLAGASVDAVSDDEMTALRLARGWQNQNIQFRLGEHHVGLDDVPIIRSSVRVTPTGIRLDGDPQMFQLLADVIDIAVEDLGGDEWDVRTGIDSDTAAAFAARLRNDMARAAHGSWHELRASPEEFASARSALVELAYGTTRATPAGVSRFDIIDLLEEISWQLGR